MCSATKTVFYIRSDCCNERRSRKSHLQLLFCRHPLKPPKQVTQSRWPQDSKIQRRASAINIACRLLASHGHIPDKPYSTHLRRRLQSHSAKFWDHMLTQLHLELVTWLLLAKDVVKCRLSPTQTPPSLIPLSFSLNLLLQLRKTQRERDNFLREKSWTKQLC